MEQIIGNDVPIVLKDDLRNLRDLLFVTDHTRLVFILSSLIRSCRILPRSSVCLWCRQRRSGVRCSLLLSFFLFWRFSISDVQNANIPE
jgi:hypothetical protein